MLDIRPLSEELKKKAKEELCEVESRIPEDIESIRNWLARQRHIKARTDDQFLVSFLRGCKYSLEKVKSKLDHFYTIKTMVPEIFGNRRIDGNTLDMCRSGFYVHLPKPLGTNGPRIHYTNFERLDQKKYNVNQLLSYEFLLLEMSLREDDNSVIGGFMEVLDLSKITMSFLATVDLLIIKKLAVFTEKGSPLRLKGIHLINTPKEAQTILLFIRNLLSEKLKQRFHIHKDPSELYQYVPQEYLPIEYGGTNGHIAEIQAEAEKSLNSFTDYIIEEDNYGVNEKLRPGRKIDTQAFFGIEGSFRKLEID